MVRKILVAAIFLSAACSPTMDENGLPFCDGLIVEALDHAAAPPANVAARVRVTDCNGMPLSSRPSAQEFELAEDDKVLSAFEASRVIEPLLRGSEQRVLITLDLSGSVTRTGLKPQMVEGVQRLIDTLDPDTRLAIFGFDGRPDLIPFSFFTGERAVHAGALNRVLEMPLIDDSTNLHGAVLASLSVLDETIRAAEDEDTVAQGTLVLFTDGSDRAGRVSESEMLSAIDATNHALFAVAMGGEMDRETLAKIGRDGRAMTGDASALGDAFVKVGEAVRARTETDYLVSYCSPARAGSRTLDIRVRRGEMTGAVSIDYEATGFGAGCTPEASPLDR